jgi:hypothetical protein
MLLPLLLLQPASALAWDLHVSFMPEALKGLAPAALAKLQRPAPAPCPAQDAATYARLAGELELQPLEKVPPTVQGPCGPGASVTPYEVLLGNPADEPDQGMDQNLPASADPSNDRKFMGGATGPNSRGFRHMYFGGWKPLKPVATFQVPSRALGQAPGRVAKLAAKARELFGKGDVVWGARVAGWAAHYLQDLSQPFHSAQIPNLRMVPWYTLWRWPPAEGFNDLVVETTRTISNYHYAFEGYISVRQRQGEKSTMADCFAKADEHAGLSYDPATQPPEELAHEVARRSVGLAPEVGAACMAFFGGHLKLRDFDLPHGKGSLDYADMTIRPDLMDARQRLEKVACASIANGVLATRRILEWAAR